MLDGEVRPTAYMLLKETVPPGVNGHYSNMHTVMVVKRITM